jgi:tRNA modification GTPase
VASETGLAIDPEAIVIGFEPGASATGQEMAELHVHGSRAVVEAVLVECARLGARPAARGEFMRRAVMNGKLSLVKAEGNTIPTNLFFFHEKII